MCEWQISRIFKGLKKSHKKNKSKEESTDVIWTVMRWFPQSQTTINLENWLDRVSTRQCLTMLWKKSEKITRMTSSLQKKRKSRWPRQEMLCNTEANTKYLEMCHPVYGQAKEVSQKQESWKVMYWERCSFKKILGYGCQKHVKTNVLMRQREKTIWN